MRNDKSKGSGKRKKRIGKLIAAGSILAVLAAGIDFALNYAANVPVESKEMTALHTERDFDKLETETVLSRENAARTFVNQSPAAPADGDKRQVFRIIEVIPHDACSIFPYLVEWGTREEYDKHVPIGYEGLMAVAAGSKLMMFSSDSTPASSSGYYTKSDEAVRRSYLEDYSVPMGAQSDYGTWYRQTQKDASGLFTANGYFEYVGTGKGLYYLATTYAVGYDVGGASTETGINHKIQAIPRKGSESPKGELYVDEPAYYWAKDYGNAGKPTYNSNSVVSQTDYNYDLSFALSAIGTYRADTLKVKSKLAGGSALDYALVIQGDENTINSWTAGFSFLKGGNYSVQDVVNNDVSGKFVRISDSGNSDHYTENDMDTGHFRAYQTDDGNCPRYDVTFVKTAWSDGYYCAEEPVTWPDSGYYFEYVGTGKGIFDVPFIYTAAPLGSEALYDLTLLKITDNESRYALTSTVKTSQNTPVYTDAAGKPYAKDYASVITYLDFKDGVNWNGKDDKNNNGIGVTLGGNDSNTLGEKGGWVFRTVTDAADMKLSFLSSFHQDNYGQNSNQDSKIAIGTRVYVKNQKLRYRYYCRDGFINNEWFKLLCFATNPENEKEPLTTMINGVGYDFSKSALWNIEENAAVESRLNSFNQSYRIEIIQKTLDQLTPDDVRSADLLYLSRSDAIEGMTANWDYISDQREKYGEEPLVPVTGAEGGMFSIANQDLSAETMLTIYDECIYKRNVALIMDHKFVRGLGGGVYTKNVEKLYFMMNFYPDARRFAQFMPFLYEDELTGDYEQYTKINSDATVNVCAASDYSGRYNIEFIPSRASYNIESWKLDYFRQILKEPEQHDEWPFTWSIGDKCDKYTEGETKLALGDYIAKTFRDAATDNRIWKILRSRNTSNYKLAVEITNAEILAEALVESPLRWVIYADEFDPASFEVRSKVSVSGFVNGKITLNNITYTFEDGTPLPNNVIAGPEVGEEYSVNVRSGFVQGGSTDSSTPLDPSITMKKVIVTATDNNGISGSAEVYVVVREAFDLN